MGFDIFPCRKAIEPGSLPGRPIFPTGTSTMTSYRLTIEQPTIGDGDRDSDAMIMALAETIVALSMKSLWKLADDPKLFDRHISFAEVRLEKVESGLDKPVPNEG
jgi:hypothetical protein